MRIFSLVSILLLGIASDLFSKWFFERLLQDHDMPIFWDFLKLQLSYNSGVAFSLPISGLPLQIITVILIAWLLYYYFHEEYPKNKKLLDVGYTLIIAWAISHAYERIFIGHVIDFVAVKYFAILNFADIFISIGAFLIIFSYVMNRKHR